MSQHRGQTQQRRQPPASAPVNSPDKGGNHVVPAAQSPAAITGQTPLADAGFDPRKGSLISQMLFNPDLAKIVNQLAADLAAMPSVPPHARGNRGLMLWAIDMHLKTGLWPLFLINGLFDPGNGKLGSTAELCLAVALSTGGMRELPIWHTVGDWSKVRSKFTERKVDKSDGKGGKRESKFAVPTYTAADETGLGLRVEVHWADKPKPIIYPQGDDAYWMADCYPRFSTQWATDPLQQTKNFVLRKIMRTVRPDLMNGMPIDEDAMLEHRGPMHAREINPANADANSKLDAFAEAYGVTDAVDDPAEADAPDDAQAGLDLGDQQENQPEEIYIWLNDENPEHPVDLARGEAVIERAFLKAASQQQVNDLWRHNQQAMQRLGGEVSRRMWTLAEKRLEAVKG